MAIWDNKYVSFTTFRRDGTPRATPVWIAPLEDGRAGFTTSSSSWKVKRLANDPAVTLTPCDMRGRVTEGARAVDGTADVVGGTEFTSTQASVKAKYGLAWRTIQASNRVMGLFGRKQASDVAVIVTLND